MGTRRHPPDAKCAEKPGALRIEVRGRVQGVGFRPFVYAHAVRLGLSGSVQNRGGTVAIAIEGPRADLERFVEHLRADLPPLARIDEVTVEHASPRGAVEGFVILPSCEDHGGRPTIAPDTATCDACLRELDDPNDRHHGYPFLSCTACGPRLTIVLGAPWDRARTTMADFPLCAACRAAYEDPTDRRFHAQPIACPACGPQLVGGTIESFAARIESGAIGALKGLGGFHLVCDARNVAAVSQLRLRKGRPHEPLGVMFADLESARRYVHLDEAEAALLTSPLRPIVLARRRDARDALADSTSTSVADVLAAGVAPGLGHLGVMLPYSALHVLLLRAVRGTPLVMTSANLHGAPMLYTQEDEPRLAHLADLTLTHPRAIALRCDDSIVRAEGGDVTYVRLGRGAAPLSLELPHPLAIPTVALGGHLKSAFAIAVERDAVLGPHVGDLDDLESERSYTTLLERLASLYRMRPERAVVDRHPDYATRRIARELGLREVEVDHHHAHFASCMAEHGLEGDVLGVIFDGAGLGPDGTLWGGELLVGSYAHVERVGHLRGIAIAGGERAFHEPWRVAYALLLDADLDADAIFEARFDIPRARRVAIHKMIDSNTQTIFTTSAGRWFDAAAYLSGVVTSPTFEAHGPMWLEAAAWRAGSPAGDGYPVDVHEGALLEIDPRAMWSRLLDDLQRARAIPEIAADFHEGLASATSRAVVRACRTRGVSRVVLSGGVFVNQRFAAALERRLSAADLRVFRHRRLPPNDGGLAFGQLAICAMRDR